MEKAWWCPSKDQEKSPYPLRCEDHRRDTDVKVKLRRCVTCNAKDAIPKDCDECRICRGFVDETRLHKKELRMKKVLDRFISDINDRLKENEDEEVLKEIVMNHDVAPQGTRYRPDFFIDFGEIEVIVEVDEHQHRGYDSDEEEERMKCLHLFAGSQEKSMVFVRYNPDSYTDSDGTRVRGLPKDPKRERVMIELLERLIRKSESGHSFPPVSVYRLFFDGWEGKAQRETLVDFEE